MEDNELRRQLIQRSRDFTKGQRAGDYTDADFPSDQELKKPQPPLVKAPMAGPEQRIPLTRDFDGLLVKADLTQVIRDRRSSRVYTQETVTLAQLSYLLWATQGVKDIRGKSYATIRTVPCGGARHEFETYMLVRQVEGLAPGRYHYLPMDHALEYLGPVEDMEGVISASLQEQVWAAKANLVFYWSMVAYRAEWRYSVFAHRVTLMDIGHVGENMYLACTGLGLGTCGVGAFCHELLCSLFALDGEEEYPVYAMPVGTTSGKDKAAEKAFYQFVEDEGL